MTSARKKPTAGFWIAVALVAVLVYVVSFGPACWMTSRAAVGVPSHKRVGIRTVNVFYFPIMKIYDISPDFIRRGITWYSRIGAADSWGWTKADTWADLVDNDSIAKD